MHSNTQFIHVTAMRLAFESAIRSSSGRTPVIRQVRKVLSRRRNKPGVIFHRQGWRVIRGG